MEKIFDVMGCEDALKTRLVVYKFEGNALAWWKAYKQAKGGDAWLERLKREYHSIRQTSTETSTEFMQRFLRLAGFLGAAAGTEEEQAKNFHWGLRRQRSGDRHQPTSQQSSHRSHGHHNDRHGSDRRGGSNNHRCSNNNYSGSNSRNSGYGRDQRNRGHQSNRFANFARFKHEKEAHSSPFSVHPGSTKMYHDLKQYFWWSGMKRDVATFVSKCLICQQVKIEHKRASGLLQQLDIPVWKWDEIPMEFVTGLPQTQRRHDAIWVVVDRLTKSAYFLPIRKDYPVSRLAEIFQQEIVRLHGTPLAIVSDRDPHFTSHFLERFTEGLGNQA
nr:DNA/RNA polymerase superfamily protein [Tanacetum cinerariifolium]